MVSLVSPAAKSPRRRETGNRRPRMHGLPVQTFGSIVMRSSLIVLTFYIDPKLSAPAPRLKPGPSLPPRHSPRPRPQPVRSCDLRPPLDSASSCPPMVPHLGPSSGRRILISLHHD